MDRGRRNAEIIKMYTASVPIADIAKRFNISDRMVRKILTQAGVERKPGRRGPSQEAVDYSPTHRRIGSKLHAHRMRTKTSTGWLGAEKLAEQLGVAKTKVGEMEEGRYPFTLSQVLDIAKILKITPEELLRG